MYLGDVLSRTCSLVTWLCVMWALLILCQRLRLEHKCVVVPRGIQQEEEPSSMATVAVCVLYTSCPRHIGVLILFPLIVWDVTLPQQSELVELSSLRVDFVITCLGVSVSCEIWDDKALYTWEGKDWTSVFSQLLLCGMVAFVTWSHFQRVVRFMLCGSA